MTQNMTVADLRHVIDSLPDDAEISLYDTTNFVFIPAHSVTHDKRSNAVTIWFNGLDSDK